MRLMKITLRNKEIITARNALEMYIALHLGRYGDIGFRPLRDSIAHHISKKYQLYR